MNDRPRRLVVLSHTGLRSGAETVLLRGMEWAVGDGWEVELLSDDGPLRDAARALSVATTVIPDLKLPALPRPLAVPVTAARGLRAGRILRRRGEDADVVLLNGLLGLPALWIARRLGLRTPAAWEVHDVIHRREWLALLRRVGPAADVALAVSDASAAPVRAAGLPVEVIPNGTVFPVEPGVPRTTDDRIVGCAGLLTPWKGQDVLLEAFARLDRDDVRLELAGGSFPKDADYVERLHARAERADLAGRVDFLGAIDHAVDRMRTWDVAVNASVDPEAASLVLLEYMSLGLAVIATDHGGTEEMLRHEGVGVGVRPGDVDELADALGALLSDPARCRSLGATARSVIAEHYTLDQQRVRFLHAIEALVSPSAPPPPGEAC